MGLRIDANIPALNADRQTQRANDVINDALRQLASGKRINRAKDDAAGLAIADALNTRSRLGQVEIRNLQSGINYAQTAEGGLTAQQDAVQRIRELAVQASNGTLSADQRAALNAEAQQLIEQVGQTAESTQYNGQTLLDESRTVELGTENPVQVATSESTPASLGLTGLDLSTLEGAANAISAADAALSQLSDNRAETGAQINRFASAIEQRQTSVLNNIEAESAIRDAELAQAVLNRTRGQLVQQGSLYALIQSNIAPQSALNLLNG